MTPAPAVPPVVGPLPAGVLRPPDPAPGSLVRAMREDPDALAYFLLNVGDGDTQLLVLPPDSKDKLRRLIVVDIATARKLPALLESLVAAGIIETPERCPRQVRLLVATHPHFDHIGGMPEFLDRYDRFGHADLSPGSIEQLWEPGFFFPSPAFHNLMGRLEMSPWIRRLQPTSGTTLYLDAVKVTVMGPGVGLRTRFDTYGVGVNDASITLMVEYPAARLYSERDPEDATRRNRRAVRRGGTRLLLGADAQFASWAQATVDFPDLAQEYNSTLAAELRAARGRDYLAADIFKLSHHASKHGITLELLERIGASQTLISATAGGGRYRFPHGIAMEAAREARQPTTSRGRARLSDHELGIHLTGARLDTPRPQPAGSIVVLVPRRLGARMRMFRLMDDARRRIDLAASREVVLRGAPRVSG